MNIEVLKSQEDLEAHALIFLQELEENGELVDATFTASPETMMARFVLWLRQY